LTEVAVPQVEETLAWSDELEAAFRIFNETGLFKANPAPAEAIVNQIARARRGVKRGDLETAASLLAEGELELQRCIYAKSFLWRLVHVHQFFIFAYHVAAILFFLNVASGWFTFVTHDVWREIPVPMSALVAGGLGACLRGMWYLWRQVSKRIFRVQFLLAQLAAPWIGMLFGLFVFLLLKASLLTLSGGSSVKPEQSALPLAIAFLSGYSWEWILARIDQVRSAAWAVGTPPSAGTPSKKSSVSPPPPGAPSPAPSGTSSVKTGAVPSEEEAEPDPFLTTPPPPVPSQQTKTKPGVTEHRAQELADPKRKDETPKS